MLDEQHGEPVVFEFRDPTRQLLALIRIHPCRRFVENKDARLGAERSGNLEESLPTVGKVTGARTSALFQSDELERFHRPLSHRPFFCFEGPRPQDGAENSTVRLGVVADHRVLQDRHRLPQANRLEGTSDARAGNCPRRQVVESVRAKRDTAAVGPIHAG